MTGNHGVEKPAANDFSFCVEFNGNGFGQAIFVGIQAADAVRKRFGQHRNRAVRKINARAPSIGFLIQGTVGSNVMSNIGDGNQKLIAIIRLANVNGVVEVAGVLAVDGNDGQSPQIDARGYFLRRDRVSNLVRLAIHFLRKTG
jgi:hypothetical protein